MTKAKTIKRKPKMGKAAGPRAPVTLHCPYCHREQIFGYDPHYDAFRCMGCGVSTRDFHVRSADRLWDPNHEKAVHQTILDSGVICSSRSKVQAMHASLPKATWEPPEEKTPFFTVTCSCGATWQATAGLTACPQCLRIYRVGHDEGVKPEGRDEALRCPSCGAVVADRPEKGAAYLCLNCDTWVGADAEGRKVAGQEARREREQREAFYPTPENLRDEGVRAVILECYAFSAENDWCWRRDGKCLLYLGRRCRWFDDAVWPIRFKVWGELKARRERPVTEAPAVAQVQEEAQEEAPVIVKARPRTDAWEFDGNTWALYTEDPARAEEARKAGLREMCAYTRRGATFAWQFLGPKDLVRELAGRRKGEKKPVPAKEEAPGKREEKARHPAALSVCSRCGGQFEPRSNRQTYCDTCAKAAERERKAEWKRAKAAAAKGDMGQK